MKKYLVALVLLLPLVASAQTASSTVNLEDVIKQLQAQIQLLQSQVADLQPQIKSVKIELAFTRALAQGSSGDDVKQLQEFLKTFLDVYPEGLVTGYFGSLTEVAVKRFQEQNSIESIGIVGPKTQAKLKEVSVGGNASSAPFGRSLAPGMSGTDVQALQAFLVRDPSVYPEGLVTGYFGPLTKKAVATFQQKHGLDSVGQVGPKTLSRLNNLVQTGDSTSTASQTASPSFTQSTSTVPQAANPAAGGTTRVIIRFKAQPGVAEENLVRSVGGSAKRTLHLIPVISAEVPTAALDGLAHNPNIVSVEPDQTVRLRSDVEYNNTWGIVRIGADVVQNSGDTGKAIKVAVIDTGVDYTHPDLHYAGGYNFLNNTTDPMDDNGHGTHVAGTIAALKNGVGVVGAAPDIELYALKVLDSQGSGYFSDVIAALQWSVDNGILITNNSYGADSYPGTAVEDAFKVAEAKGILNIAAAGNAGTCTGDTNAVAYPARFASVVAVAALDSSNTRPCFSSTGAEVELAAPGVSINSTRLGGGDVVYSGTSMASAHVAGAAALVAATGVTDTNNDGRINDEIRNILDASALDLGASGRDPWYGFGLVEADKAVASIGQTPTATSTSGTATTFPATSSPTGIPAAGQGAASSTQQLLPILPPAAIQHMNPAAPAGPLSPVSPPGRGR